MHQPTEDNRNRWDKGTEMHVGSRFHDVPGALAGTEILGPHVLDAVPDVNGMCRLGDLGRWGRVVAGFLAPNSVREWSTATYDVGGGSP